MSHLPDLHTRTTGGKQHVSRFADSKTDRSGWGVQACAGVLRDPFRYVYASRGDADFKGSVKNVGVEDTPRISEPLSFFEKTLFSSAPTGVSHR